MTSTDRQFVGDPITRPATDPRCWVEQYGDALYRFALARVRRTDVAEDLVQETFLAAWRGRAEFAGQSSERTWLTAILKRKVVDWLRQRVRERLQANADSQPDGFAADLFTRRGEWKTSPGQWHRGDPTGSLEREEFWAVLHACLAKLPPRLHDAFALRYLDETAGREVCQELGLTPSNLWVMLYRARVRMWWCLSRNWFGEEPQGGERIP